MCHRSNGPARKPLFKDAGALAPRVAGTLKRRADCGTLVASHRRTTVRTSPAYIGTALHLGIFAHRFAGSCALAAHLRASVADRRMHSRATQHRVGAGGADIRAGRQQCDMVRGSVRTALAETVVDGFQADGMALRAVVDALVHGLGSMGRGMMCHVRTPSCLPCGRKPARPRHRPYPIQCCAKAVVEPSCPTSSTVYGCVRPIRHLHAGRTHRHAGQDQSLSRQALRQQPLDVIGRNVPFDDVAADLGGMTGAFAVGHAQALLERIEVVLVMHLDGEPGLAQMFHP